MTINDTLQRASLRLSVLEFRGKREYGLCIRHKEEVMGWRVLSAVISVLTFGKVSLLKKFWTTIGNVVYVPKRVDQNGKVFRFGDLPYEDYCTLSHELAHVKHFYNLGFPSVKGGKAVGVLLMLLLYFFVFFPVGLAYARYRFEREAYMAGLLAAHVIGLEIPQRMELAIRYCSTSPTYLWMWPFPQSVRRWFVAEFASRCRNTVLVPTDV